jgi:hypothetical protein
MKKPAPPSKAKRQGEAERPAAANPAPPPARIRPENGLDGFESLTPSEAITWAAFGQAVEADDLVRLLPLELERWSTEPRHWLPKLFHRPRNEPLWGEFSPSEILDTLVDYEKPANTLSEEQLRPIIFYLKKREKLSLTPFHIIRGRSTSDHIEFLRRYLAKAADFEMQLIARKREFLKLISLGHVLLSGLPVGPHNQGKPPREKIKKEDILPGISMSFDGYLTDAGGWTLYQDLSVQLDDVQRCYPFGPIEPINPVLLQLQQPPNTSKQPETVRQVKGGRPRGESTLLAQSELARLLASGKLPQKPRDILAHLEEFFEREGKTMPAESTLKEMIRAFLQGLKQSKNPSENLAGN